ncbi:NAD(P)-dependent oxidoreductase [Candidatus Leptofilum sp.]|uniref:NAD(P)-dependent oxidoreductase n=1 Tax=Candidatus Leptofilum sp. TaxID=3241576 RepID=UPI003B5A11BB
MAVMNRQDGRRPHILICDPIHKAGVSMLQEQMYVDVKTNLSHQELLNIVHEYDGLVVENQTSVTADLIDHALNLRLIGRAGSGFDQIDVIHAQEKEIAVINCPDANTLAVAEHTMGLLLSLARRLPRAYTSLKAGQWDSSQLIGTGLSGKTLGIVGFGRIGREVAIRAEAFGMNLLVNEPSLTPELRLQDKIQRIDLYELLEKADFISLHVPLRPETRHMVSTRELNQMKKTAYLINTARGGLIDEAALLTALDEGGIAGAALDVFQTAPQPNRALIEHPSVITTPRIAASTDDAHLAASITLAEQIIEFFQEVEVSSVLPLRVVPMDKVMPHEHFDQKRVDRLAGRLEEDGVLGNPPVVIESEDGRYIVLDGATRTTAMKQLGYKHGIVQVISTEDGLGLHTWYHVICKIRVNELLALLQTLPDITMQETDIERATDEMFEYGGLCYVQLIDNRVFLIYPAHGVNRLEALNQFTEAYIDAAGHVDRTLNDNILSLKNEYEELAGVVIFPEYTVTQVMAATLSSGRLFPAGITRFIIPGRILRLNAELSVLKSDMSLREKNRWLHELLVEKQGKGGIRFYGEPVYLLDE